MKHVIAVTLLAVVMAVMATGCRELELRNSADETQRQSAQAAMEIAAAMQRSGFPPDSPAGRQLLRAVMAQLADTGFPRQPVDVSGLLPSGVTQAWVTRTEQIERWKMKEQLAARVNELLARQATDIADTMKAATKHKKIDAGDYVHRVQALVDTAAMGAELAASIPVPADPGVSEAEAARMAAIDSELAKINKIAATFAARKPSPAEVANRGLAYAGQVVEENPELFSILGGVPVVGGVLAWLRGRNKKRKIADELNAAKHDAATAQRERSMVQATAIEAQSNVAAMGKLVDKVTTELAKAPPPPAV